MSLKAKIEAVIYASEEPVTLAQLIGLLGQEAQAELDRLDAAQQSLPLEDGPPPQSDPDPEPAPAHGPPHGLQHDDSLRQPEATASAPSQEPEPTDASPVPEHPAAEPSASEPGAAAADPKSVKQEEKARDRRLREYFRSILDELIADYATSARGLEIREVASGYRLATKPEYHDAVRGFVKSLKPPLKLSLQALETLAVVAYKQPITAPEISEIRGVDSGGVLGSLMARKLITTAGRKQVIGRPILYKTTRDFLLRFGLKDVSELPSIEEFEKMAGELADTFAEPVQEEIPMQTEATESPAELEPEALEEEKDASEPQSDGDSIPLEGSDESSAGTPGKTVATPEGDNEFAPDQPLEPIDEGHQKPPAIDTNKL
jgi:segregation and condensation protein B